MKKQGHYCRICGEYKANEKFTGKGHASHICRKCQSLSQDERNTQAMITRIMNLPYRLSKDQTEWLKKLRKDRRTEVSECAEEAYEMRFPYAERNERKGRLHIRLLEFHVCGEMYDSYGDTYDICAKFTVDKQKHTIVREQNESSVTVTLDSKEMSKLLKRMIHSYEVFCWNEDYGIE